MSERSGLDMVFVAGPPGAGKTTVAEQYQKVYPHTEQFGTGELVWGIRDGDIKSRYAPMLRDLAQSGSPIPADVFSGLVHERVMQIKDSTETVMVTGFPHDYSDWELFNEALGGSDVLELGSVVLDAGLDTCIARMQERDVNRGKTVAEVASAEEIGSYQKRYHDLKGRLAIRLDCYSRSGLEVVTVSAENPRDQVSEDFNDVIRMFKEGKV